MRKVLLYGLCLGFSLLTGNAFAQTLFVNENFNAMGIPAGWTVGSGGSTTNPDTSWVWVPAGGGNGGNDLDGTGFMTIDSDAAGSTTRMEDTLYSPVFNGIMGSPGQILFEFDHHLRTIIAPDTGYVEVYNGTNWIRLAAFGATTGAWSAPAAELYDITAYANANMQVRFRYNNFDNWAWYWSVDNVRIYAPAPDDVGVTAILGPASGCGLSTMEQISIEIENLGLVPISSPLFIPVRFEVNGVAGPQEYIPVLKTLNPGDTLLYTSVSGYNMSTTGTTYNIRAYTEYAIDANNTNDTLGGFSTVNKAVINSFPYFQSFDGPGFVANNGTSSANTGGNPVTMAEGWDNDPNDDGQDWAIRTTQTPSGSTGPLGDHTTGSGKYVYVEDSNPFDNQAVNLLSPCFDVGALSCPTLSMWVSSNNANNNPVFENELHVDIFYLGNEILDIVPPIGNLGTIDWQKVDVDLSSYTFGVIQLRFRVNNDNGNFSHDIAIDDVSISDKNNGDVELFSTIGLASGCGLSNIALLPSGSSTRIAIPSPIFLLCTR